MNCKVCGKTSESDYCFQHKQRTKLSKGAKLSTLATKKVSVGKASNQDHLFFKEIWEHCPHLSEISGTYLGKEASSAFFHHILPKNKYPHIRMDKENIILLTIDEHANVESDIYKYEKINKRRELLKIKYKLL
jgi:hypothetical protein